MARIVWSPIAAGDLEEICEYIAKDSPKHAAVFARQVVAVARELASLPQSGKPVPEWNDPLIRQRVVGNYRLIYRTREDRVEIVRVVHGARLLE